MYPERRRAERRRRPPAGDVPGVRRHRAVGEQRARLRRRQRRRRRGAEGRGDGGHGHGLVRTCPSSTRRTRPRTARRTSTARGTRPSRRTGTGTATGSASSSTTSSTRSTITCWPRRSASPRRPATSRRRTRAGQGSGATPSKGHFIDGANTANGFPDGGHVNNANFSTPADGEPGVMQMYLQRAAVWGAEHPVRRLGQRGRDRVSRVRARVVQPPGHDARRHPGAERAAVRARWARAGATGTRSTSRTTTAGSSTRRRTATRSRSATRPATRSSFRTSAADCPVGVAATNCPVDAVRRRPGGYTYADYGKIVGGPEVHADGEIWVQTLWEMRELLGSRRDGVDRHARHGAVAAGAVVPGHAERDPAGGRGRLRGSRTQDALWTLFAERGMGYFAAAADGSDVHPVADFDDTAGLRGRPVRHGLRHDHGLRDRARRWRACTSGSPVTCRRSGATSAT